MITKVVGTDQLKLTPGSQRIAFRIIRIRVNLAEGAIMNASLSKQRHHKNQFIYLQ